MLKTIIGSLVGVLCFSGIAMAQTCASYTYTLANGTTADASQVMGNFNTVRNCVNTLQSGGTFVTPDIGAATGTSVVLTGLGTFGGTITALTPHASGAGPHIHLQNATPGTTFSGTVRWYDGNGNRGWEVASNSAIGSGYLEFNENTTNRAYFAPGGGLTLTGTLAVTGTSSANGGLIRGIATETAATRTVAATDTHIIANRAGTITLTLPTASSFTGRELTVRTITNNAVVSNASNVIPCAGGSADAAILTAAAGNWALLVSDGTNWQIQMCK